MQRELLIRGVYSFALVLAFVATVGLGVLLESKLYVFKHSSERSELNGSVKPFPVGVNPVTRQIVEDPAVDTFFSSTLASQESQRENWLGQLSAVLFGNDWYQQLASPVSRIIVIWPGERREEVAQNIGDVLRWNKSEREEFAQLIKSTDPVLLEGKFLPGQYVTHRRATPQEIANTIHGAFENEILKRYPSTIEASIPLEDTLILASLLEREASDFENMREISGIIWNRLFIDMPLQLDATLQYAKGSRLYEPSWWPPVRPADKYIDSPFNTYMHEGLPPTPIANPSTEAVLAALNPRETECLYYFHDTDKSFYCSETYEEHVAKLRNLYGQGR